MSPDNSQFLSEQRGDVQRDGPSSRRVPRFGHGSRVPGWDEAVDLTKDPAVVPDLANTPVPDRLRDDIEAAMAKYPDRRSAVIPALHAAQGVHGWCSPQAIVQVAAVMALTPAYLTSVATFYDMFAMAPKPRHDIFVCTNISCSLLGADEFLAAMQSAAEGGDAAVRSFECLGACDIGPMASVDGEYVGPLETSDAEQIIADLSASRPVLPAKQLRYRRCVDPGAETDPSARSTEFGAPGHPRRADTVGLTAQDAAADRPGPPAAIELHDAETGDDA